MGNKFTDAVGDRIKGYEARETDRKAMRGIPLVARLDGRSFSKFTRGMKRPFDQDLADLMVETTKFLVEQNHASVGYTQSDEISLVFDPFGRKRLEADNDAQDFPETDFLFDGRFQKLTSVLAGQATARFLIGALDLWPDLVRRTPPVFDCRVFEVPSREEAVAALAWREWDATKNAVSMAARAQFPHSRLQNKSSAEMQEMLFQEKGINFNDYPPRFKRGVYVRRRNVEKFLDESTLARIPLEKRPTGPVLRSETAVLDLPPISKILNKVEVLLDGSVPLLASPIVPAVA